MLLICFLLSFLKPLKAAYLITKNRHAAARLFVAPCYVIKPLKAILAPLTRQKVIYTTLRQKAKNRAHNGVIMAYRHRATYPGKTENTHGGAPFIKFLLCSFENHET